MLDVLSILLKKPARAAVDPHRRFVKTRDGLSSGHGWNQGRVLHLWKGRLYGRGLHQNATWRRSFSLLHRSEP
jgi:hypothetical protein